MPLEYVVRLAEGTVTDATTGRTTRARCVWHIPTKTRLPGLWTKDTATHIARMSNHEEKQRATRRK